MPDDVKPRYLTPAEVRAFVATGEVWFGEPFPILRDIEAFVEAHLAADTPTIVDTP